MCSIRYNVPALRKLLFLFFVFGAAWLLTGCSSPTKTVRIKINSQPEGAHVVYRMTGEDLPCQGQWIYLGNTPLRGVRHFNEGQLKKTEKITLKVIQNGYLDQVIEWDGPGFWEEAEGRGVIFWTPEMIPQPHE